MTALEHALLAKYFFALSGSKLSWLLGIRSPSEIEN
jgi:hypothetical protein